MRIVLYVAAAGLLVLAFRSQWRSFDRAGERRFETLNGSPKEIVVGVCWPFSVNHDGMAEGIQLAHEEINAGGLAGGIPIRLVLRDDRFDWEQAKSIAVEFAEDPSMSAVIGYYDDGTAIKASGIFESSRLLHIVIGANNTAMTRHKFQYIVRTTVTNENIARSLAKMLVDRNKQRFALIWEEDAYGEDLAYQFNVSLNSFNTQLVYEWSYSRDRPDFRLPANELKGVAADVVFFAGLEPWAGDFLRTARGVGVETEIVGAFSDTPEMRRRAGNGLEGSMYFDIYNRASEEPENQKFVHNFRKRYGKDPDSWAAQGYDALHILAQAIRKTSSANPLDLSYAIRYMKPWQGANGRYAFNDRGEMYDKAIYLNRFRNGAPVVIQRSHPASPAQSNRPALPGLRLVPPDKEAQPSSQ